MSKTQKTQPARVYRVSPVDPATKLQARDKDGKPVIFWFDHPIASGAPIDASKALKLDSTPIKDNVLSAQTGEDIYYDADTMTDQEKKALRAQNALTVGSKRLSDVLDKIASARKTMKMNARFIPESNRIEAWAILEREVMALKHDLFPAPETESKPKGAKAKVNHFQQWFAK